MVGSPSCDLFSLRSNRTQPLLWLRPTHEHAVLQGLQLREVRYHQLGLWMVQRSSETLHHIHQRLRLRPLRHRAMPRRSTLHLCDRHRPLQFRLPSCRFTPSSLERTILRRLIAAVASVDGLASAQRAATDRQAVVPGAESSSPPPKTPSRTSSSAHSTPTRRGTNSTRKATRRFARVPRRL